jgi:hypothetical protein
MQPVTAGDTGESPQQKTHTQGTPLPDATRTYKPKRYSATELRKAGVELIGADRQRFRCLRCRCEWINCPTIEGRHRRLYWQCPAGCNDPSEKNAIPAAEATEYYRGWELKAAGWTNATIRKYLDPPDRVGPIRWKSHTTTPQRLYGKGRVDKIVEYIPSVRPRVYGHECRDQGQVIYDALIRLQPGISERDNKILRLLLVDQNKERRVAKRYGLSQQTVSYVKRAALRKLTDIGVNLPIWLGRWSRNH